MKAQLADIMQSAGRAFFNIFMGSFMGIAGAGLHSI